MSTLVDSNGLGSDAKGIDSFPRFSTGDVLISLSDNEDDKLKLHKTTLSHNLPWFKTYFADIDSRSLRGEGSIYKLGLTYTSSEDLDLVLTEDDEDSTLAGYPGIKMEDEDHKPERKSIVKKNREEDVNQLRRLVLVEAYHNLLRAIYSIPPKLDISNLESTLDQCEALVIIAKHYDALALVRMFLSNSLTERRHSLYEAVAQNPPRWLNLSIYLQSKAIFSEAVIHCTGGFPGFKWPTSLTAIDEQARHIVYNKVTTLTIWTQRVELELLANTLLDPATKKPVSPTHGAGSWTVVSLFRDWMLGERRKLAQVPEQCQFASSFRTIFKGGDDYLELDEVEYKVGQMFVGTSHKFMAEDSLKKLKILAKQMVEQLMTNNLMIDPEATGIPYLTCTEVTDEDYPWL